jgi:hypothetical protein
MSTDKSFSDEQPEDDLVIEDYFVEEYVAPLTLEDETDAYEELAGPTAAAPKAKRTLRKLLAKVPKRSLVGLLVLSGVAFASALLWRGRHRQSSPFSRLFLRLGIAK